MFPTVRISDLTTSVLPRHLSSEDDSEVGEASAVPYVDDEDNVEGICQTETSSTLARTPLVLEATDLRRGSILKTSIATAMTPRMQRHGRSKGTQTDCHPLTKRPTLEVPVTTILAAKKLKRQLKNQAEARRKKEKEEGRAVPEDAAPDQESKWLSLKPPKNDQQSPSPVRSMSIISSTIRVPAERDYGEKLMTIPTRDISML